MANAYYKALYLNSRKILVSIQILHIVLVIATLWLLYSINLQMDQLIPSQSLRIVIINSALLGFLGSLFYFSRKVYVYLISDKLFRIAPKYKKGQIADVEDRYRGILIGYYVYLITRPIAGLFIGPLLLMFILAGLTTFAKPSAGCEITVSGAGIYLIYVLSFIGGYSSSDLFDYLANLGKKLIKRITFK